MAETICQYCNWFLLLSHSSLINNKTVDITSWILHRVDWDEHYLLHF